MFKAVIFDMDGVIIDSEPMHARAAILALKKYNIDITMDYLQNFIGSTVKYMCQKMVDDFHIDATWQDLQKANSEMKDDLLKLEGHIVIPYITDLMKDLYKNRIKLSIASSSPPEAIEEVMESLDIKKYFQDYVSGSNVPNPKPAPDIFLEAARRLDVKPVECIVIEDSFHGVTAANAAGMTCIGFANPNSGNQDLRKAAILVEGFDEVDYTYLSEIYRQAHGPITVFTTDRFLIRELTESDIPSLYQIYQKPQIREYQDGFNDSLELEIEKHKAYIQNVYRFYGYGLWGVFFKDSNRLIGRCGIEYKVLDGEEIYEIGYLLDPEYQKKGYAREFVTEVLNYSFRTLGIPKITAVIDTRNHRSIHLAEQVGMKRSGECVRDHRYCYKYNIVNV